MDTFTNTLSLHDALPISVVVTGAGRQGHAAGQQQGCGLHPTHMAQDGLLSERALPAVRRRRPGAVCSGLPADRKSTRLNSSHVAISYADFCLKKKNEKTV